MSRLAALMFLATASLAFPADPLPRRVDLEPRFADFGLPALSQGNRDTCSLFAITALAEFEVCRATPRSKQRLSEEYLVWAANEATGSRGDQAMFYEAIHGLNELGICDWNAAPYSEQSGGPGKPSEQAASAARAMAYRWRPVWIKRWNVDQPMTDGQLTAIKSALAAGHPVACGLRWPKTLNGSALVKVPPADQVFDGHSIALTGYIDGANPSTGTFLFRNSSGPTWGKNGYGTMSYAYVKAYANDAVWLHFGSPDSERPTVRFEAEQLSVRQQQGCQLNPQDMTSFGGPMWSGSKHLFVNASQGAVVELEFPVPKAGRYRVCVQGTAAPDFGVVRFAMDGQPVEQELDLYSGRVCPSGSTELGQWELTEGKHLLQFKVTGKNPGSKGFKFGIDTIDLIATE
jgi:hypothetical protein